MLCLGLLLSAAPFAYAATFPVASSSSGGNTGSPGGGSSSTTVTGPTSWWPLVPCGLNKQPSGATGGYDYTQPCNQCHIFMLIKNLIDFIFKGLMPVLATALFVVAGFYIVLAGGNPAYYATGKKIFQDTLMAVLVISLSWLLANTVIRTLARDQNVAKSWFQFQCRATVKPPTKPAPFEQPKVEVPKPPGTGEPFDACKACSAYPGGITAGGKPVVCVGQYAELDLPLNDPSRTCGYAAPTMAEKMAALRQANDDWVVSEGFPPTINHSSPDHGDGTAVDISMRPAMSATPTQDDVERLAEICAAAQKVGLKVLNEYTNIPQNLYGSLGSCPQPRSFANTNGPHLHLSL